MAAALLTGAAAPIYLSATANATVASIPANFTVVTDQNGANDVSGQNDLTQLGRDNTDATYLKLFWSWDDASFSGANTGDACALLDTDNPADGKVNISVCVQVHTVSSKGSSTTVQDGDPIVSSCNNAWTDRCGQPSNLAYVVGTDIISGALTSSGNPDASPPADLVTPTDPFATGSDHPNDTTAEVFISKNFLTNHNASLVNVCSYPSGGFGASNNDPKDCIINPGGGALVISKDAGTNTTTDFPFTVNPGATPVTITGTNTASAIPETAGSNYSISESVPSGWTFHAVSCLLADGTTSTGTADVANHQITGVQVVAGQTTTCTITDQSDAHISLTKSANPTTFSAAGQSIDYTLTATNDGNSPLSNVSITDTDPGVTVDTANCNPAQPATLAVNATLTCHASYTTTAADVTNGSFMNTGHVSGTAQDGSSKTATATATITKSGPALSLTKTPSPATYTAAGQAITYTLTATNTGDVTLTNVSITDTDPGVTVDTANCTPAQPATLAKNATLTCTASYTTTAADVTNKSFTNTGHVSGTDPNAATVSASKSATIHLAALSLAKSASPTTYSAAGQTINYTVTATNTGSSALSNVSITDPLFGGTMNTCTDGAAHSLTPPVTLNPGDVLQCTDAYVTTAADVTAGSIHNTATGHGTSPDRATLSPTASATATFVAPGQPALSITKSSVPVSGSTVHIGDQVVYTLTYSNPGQAGATGVTVSDTLPVDLDYVANSASNGGTYDSGTRTLSWTIGSLAAGASGSVSFTGQVATTATDGEVLHNFGVAAGTGLNATSNDDNVVVAAPPVLGLVKSSVPASGSTVLIGDQVVYTLTYSNTGTGAASNVTVTDTLPADLDYVANSASNGGTYDSATRTLSWTIGALAPGASGSVTFTGQVATTATDGEVLHNVGTIAGSGTSATSNADDVTVSAPPVLALTKSSVPTSGSFVNIADQVVYTLGYSNTGTGAATGVTVTDTLPADLDYVANSASNGGTYDSASRTITWAIGTLAPGASGTVTFTAQVAATATNGEVLHNVGVINAPGISDPSNGVDVTVVVPTGALTLTKTVDKTTANYGDTLTYTVRATASGADQTNVVVTDTIPTGSAYVAGSASCAAPCTATESGGVVTWTVGTVTDGSFADLTFKVTVTKPNPAADGSIPASAITNVASGSSDQDPSVQSNKVKTNVIAVLGEKVVRKPTKKPSTLPFTGFNAVSMSLDGLILVGIGGLLTAVRRRRRA